MCRSMRTSPRWHLCAQWPDPAALQVCLSVFMKLTTEDAWFTLLLSNYKFTPFAGNRHGSYFTFWR